MFLGKSAERHFSKSIILPFIPPTEWNDIRAICMPVVPPEKPAFSQTEAATLH